MTTIAIECPKCGNTNNVPRFGGHTCQSCGTGFVVWPDLVNNSAYNMINPPKKGSFPKKPGGLSGQEYGAASEFILRALPNPKALSAFLVQELGQEILFNIPFEEVSPSERVFGLIRELNCRYHVQKMALALKKWFPQYFEE